jgi:hypothetical protein
VAPIYFFNFFPLFKEKEGTKRIKKLGHPLYREGTNPIIKK